MNTLATFISLPPSECGSLLAFLWSGAESVLL